MPKSAMNDRFIPEIAQILELLEVQYKSKHPDADIDVYRRNQVSIRIRIIDPDFQELDSIERDESIWKILRNLPDNVRSNITLLVLLTPDETDRSFVNADFENPKPSFSPLERIP
ncbi:hypothetical protein BH23PLA1_BH23PLA1_20740 [soil metagenome]